MASQRIKGITIELSGDSTKLVNALHEVDRATAATKYNLNDINKALKLDPTNVTLLKDKQTELNDKVKEARERLDIEKQALEDLEKQDGFDKNSQQAKDLKTQIDLDTAALKQAEDELKNFGSVGAQYLQAVGKEVQDVGNKIKDVGQKLKDVGQDLTTKVTVPIVTAFAGSAKAAVDWESAFTGVMKTVDETATTTYDDLKADINEIAKTTASSQNQIAATMEIAGQLGVSADNITEFTKTMIMLGDTTNLTSEEAASAIAKFANVTKMPLTEVDKLGSAIVDLGNNYATTEADIVSMATRLSGAGAQIGLSQGEILGFATALSSVGIEAEMGGSAFSKAMIKMQVAAESGASGFEEFQSKLAEIQPEYATYSFRDIQVWLTNDSKALKEMATATGYTKKEVLALIESRANLENFAEVAGMTSDEFVKAYKDDAPAALQAFIKGLGDTEGKGESTIQMLQDMGFTEVRLRDTLTRLAQSGDLVTDAVARGNEAFAENSAMSEEAEKRYATMETQFQQLKNTITEVAVSIGEILMPYIQKGVEYIGQLAEKWNSLDDSQKETILKIAAIAAAVGPVLLIIGNIVVGIGSLITAIGTITSAIGVVTGVLAGVTAPMVAVVAAIAAIIAIIVLCVKHWDEIKVAASNAVEVISQKWDEFKTKVTEVWNTLKTNVSTAVENMKNNVKNVFTAIKTDAINQFTTLKTNALNAFNNLKTGISNTVSNIKGAIISGFSSAVDYITSLPSKALGWGRDIIQSLIDGIRDKISGITDAIKDVADVIADFIHFSEPDKGPLSNFHTFMPDMMRQLAQGITQGIPQIENAMNSLAGNMAGSLTNGNMAAGGNVTNANTNTVNINVYGAQGQDVRQLANEIQTIINNEVYSKGAVFA